MGLTRVRTGAARLWAVSDYFRKVGPPWSPATAGYELWRAVEAEGARWAACMKVHAVSTGSGPGAPVQFKASVTLWPDGAARNEREKGAAPTWPDAVRTHLERLGYTGDWMKSPDGVFGDFWKDLPGLAAVRREAKLLLGLELSASALGPAATGRRRRRARGRQPSRR